MTKRLASPDSHVLALLGSGVQAKAHLEALARVREFDDVRVWSRTPEHAKRFARAFSAPPRRISASISPGSPDWGQWSQRELADNMAEAVRCGWVWGGSIVPLDRRQNGWLVARRSELKKSGVVQQLNVIGRARFAWELIME